MARCNALSRIALPCMMAVLSGASFAQQGFPDKPIRLIVPFPPGEGSGIVTQMLGPKLTEVWGQPVVVENRPGGNTVIGHEALLRLPADGHAFVISTPSFMLSAMFQKISYDPYKDFAPLTTLYNSEQVLTVAPSLPARNLKELIALAKSRPGELNYATVGGGGTTHIASELLNMMAGIQHQAGELQGGRAGAPRPGGRPRADVVYRPGGGSQPRQVRQGARHRDHRRQAHAPRYPRCPPSPRLASRALKARSGSECRRTARRPERSSTALRPTFPALSCDPTSAKRWWSRQPSPT